MTVYKQGNRLTTLKHFNKLRNFVDLDILLRLDVLDLQILLHFMEFLTLALKHA